MAAFAFQVSDRREYLMNIKCLKTFSPQNINFQNSRFKKQLYASALAFDCVSLKGNAYRYVADDETLFDGCVSKK